MSTIAEQVPAGRRRRRLHSDEFKAEAVAAASQSGVSMAAVALSRGINANLLRRWVRDAEMGPNQLSQSTAPMIPAFVPLRVPQANVAADDIRVELRRGPITMIVTWPASAAADFAIWTRELLR